MLIILINELRKKKVDDVNIVIAFKKKKKFLFNEKQQWLKMEVPEHSEIVVNEEIDKLAKKSSWEDFI